MRKFKKALAFALASAMIVSVVPVSAATSNTAKAGKKVIYTYTVNKGATKDAKQTWIKTTTKKGYTVKLVNKTKKIVSLTGKKVVAKKAGTAKINVNFYKGKKYVATKAVKITVKKAPTASGIKLEKDTLNVGETTKVVHSGTAKVNCFSADTSIVTVNKKTGEVTAVAPGTTKIAVRNTVTKKRVYVDITVNAELAAKQTGVKQITLTGSNFTKDTKVEVKRGNTTVDVDTTKVEASADGKTMILPTKSLITAGEYTVTVGEKTVKFTGEASKVTTIDVSDVAVVDNGVTLPVASDAVSGAAATIAYTVKNQFGEDITKTTSVDANASRTSIATPSQGKFRVQLNAYDKADDLISVVFIYKETGLSVNKTVKISNAAAANEVTVKGVYNEAGKTLNEDTMENNSFYLLLDVVDQYGKNMAENNFQVGTTMASDLIVSAAPGATGVTLDTSANSTTVKTVGGKKYVAVPLQFTAGTTRATAGTVSVVLITKLGKTFTGSFEVAAGKKVDTFTASPSDVVVAGTETVFDFTAIDTYGNDISQDVVTSMFSTSTTVFNGQNADGTEKAGYFKFAKDTKTGKNQLVFVAKNASTDRLYVGSFITATNKVVNVQFTIKAKAEPVSLETVSNFGMVADTGRTKTVNASDIKVTNQYGSDYTFNTLAQDGYTLTVESVGANTTTPSVTAAVSGSSVLFTSNGTPGTSTFAYVLKKGTKELSREEFTVTTKELDDIVTKESDVTITDIPKMYHGAPRALEVKAKVNGLTVDLEAGDDYVVVTADKVTANVVSTSAISMKDSETEKTGKYTVIIKNKLGTEITKEVTVSKEKRKATSASVNSTNGVLPIQVDSTTIFVSDVLRTLTVKDQYGEEIESPVGARVAFSDYAENVTPVDNNTVGANVTVEDGQTVTAKITFVGGYTYTTIVGVKKVAATN